MQITGENLNLKSRISRLEEKLSSTEESLENSSNYVQIKNKVNITLLQPT